MCFERKLNKVETNAANQAVIEGFKFKKGNRVFIPVELNSYWTGEGEVISEVLSDSTEFAGYTMVKMKTGQAAGREGAFNTNALVKLSPGSVPETKPVGLGNYNVGLIGRQVKVLSLSRSGQVGIIREASATHYKLDFEDNNGLWYGASEVELLPELAVLIPETKYGFTIGQRVRLTAARLAKAVTDHGVNLPGPGTGTVVGFSASALGFSTSALKNALVVVKMDGGTEEAYWYPENLEIDPNAAVLTARVEYHTTDPNAAIPPHSGVNKVVVPATSRRAILILAQGIAARIGRERGTVTADEVQERLSELGYSSKDLGNAAGSVFRGPNFEKYTTIQSKRAGNRGRTLQVWKYIGPDAVTPDTPISGPSVGRPSIGQSFDQGVLPEYIVQVSFNQGLNFSRSGNDNIDGINLLEAVYHDLGAAQAEVKRQVAKGHYQYRVAYLNGAPEKAMGGQYEYRAVPMNLLHKISY